MLSSAIDHSWDLTPVIDLIYSLSSKDDPFIAHNGSVPSKGIRPIKSGEELDGGEQSLGNFDKLWEYLGQAVDIPPPIIEPISSALGNNLPDEGGCGFGDVRSEQTPSQSVRWQDRHHGSDLPKEEILHTLLATPERSGRKKKSEKKQHGKVFAQEAELASYSVLPIIRTSSGEDSDAGLQQIRVSPDRKSVIYEILYGNTPYGKKSTPYGNYLSPGSTSPLKSTKAFNLKDWPVSQTGHNNPRRQPDPQGSSSAAAKKAKLVLSLCERFPAEKSCISALGAPPSVPRNDDLASTAVHVFVDVSNILIGFHDSFKSSRGMSISTRIPRLPFSFHNLTLILERGRPTAKRVLVGSDKLPAIDEAKQIGYETNILDRVHKAKELTPRQKKYLNGKGASEQSSGSETTAVYAPQKWVEQAVDEILHLKMMESIVDVKEPSTMVLATGDAAEAEYSQGFLKMVERALEKGWKVELVSFRQNTSGAYKRGDFRSKWGKMFKIIELDDYTEELLAV